MPTPGERSTPGSPGPLEAGLEALGEVAGCGLAHRAGMLNGPPNSFCSALSVRSHLSSMLEMSAPSDPLVSVGRTLKRSAWLVAQLWTCPVAFGSDRVIETPFCKVNETSSPTGTERLNVVPSLPCSCDGSTRVSIEVLSQPSGASNPGAVVVAQAPPLD